MTKQGRLARPSEYSEQVVSLFYDEALERIAELERLLAERDAEIAELRRARRE